MKRNARDSKQSSIVDSFASSANYSKESAAKLSDGLKSFNNLKVGDSEAWCRLVRDRRWSRAQKFQLLEYFQCPCEVLSLSSQYSQSVISGQVRAVDPQVEQSVIDADLQWLSSVEHGLIGLFDDRYPDMLKQLPDPPIALFFIGNAELLAEPQVAIVGSRAPTPIGDKVAKLISQDLANSGITITSGMALGIDGVAHRAALEVEGSSIAVLGNGLDIVYPRRNKSLFSLLERDGLLVSEYPLGVSPGRYTFPQRNRIVSGLSHGVVIVEAAEKSGTLITARLAMEQNREVMVVPGSALSAQYRGSHHLLNQGAVAVSNARDVLECLAQPLSTYLSSESVSINGSVVGDSKAPQREQEGRVKIHFSHPLLAHISAESTSLDQIISSSQLTSAEVSSMLLELELQGAIAVAVDGGYVNLS